MAIIPDQNLWNIIAIIIALDLIYQDFDTSTISILKTGKKSINKIYSILQSKEAKNLDKQATRDVNDLVMGFMDKKNTLKKR